VVFLLSIPLWWVTTSITRLPLPESRVKGLQEQKINFPLHVVLDSTLSLHAIGLDKRLKAVLQRNLLDREYSVSVSHDTSRSSSSYDVYLDYHIAESYVKGRTLHIAKRTSSTSEITNTLTETLFNLLIGNDGNPSLTYQTTQFAPRYRLSFSLLNEDASAGECPQSWDIRPAISHYIQPVLNRLSVLHNFTIESQVQFFAPLAFEPIVLENGDFGLTQEQLSVFVNSAEWTLSSGVSNDPVLHFVIFVPSASRRPLRMLESSGTPLESTAFAVPHWGSIFIYNPPTSTAENMNSVLTLDDLRLPFKTFQKELLALLGVPSLPSGLISKDVISDWQLDALLRMRTMENAQGSKDTLNSIVNLVNQIEGMPVDKDVTDDVYESLDALDKLFAVASHSPKLALQYSSRALSLASRAFFNPGMLALLYFPPEHNLAVYTPLLAPVAVPLVAAVLREISQWRKSRRAKATPPPS